MVSPEFPEFPPMSPEFPDAPDGLVSILVGNHP